MFRSVTAIVLIFSVLIGNLTKVMVYAGFELNETYIVTELCENRDQPEMNCNGQCYLAKKLKQAEEKEKQQERDSQKHHFQEAFITEKPFVKPTVQFLETSSRDELVFILPQPSFVIFHPPKVS